MDNTKATRALETYWYDDQLVGYIVQFMAVFAGLQVAVGDNDHGGINRLMSVPIRYGNADRVVTAIKAGNTQNSALRVPAMAAKLIGIDMAPELRKGVGTHERDVVLQRGAAFPAGLKVLEKYQPVPYVAVFELAFIVSNSLQQFQLLEQILTLFDPMIQIQTSDDVNDWNRITTVELLDIGLEENYPIGTDKRLIVNTLKFSMPIRLAPPTSIKKNYISQILMRLQAISGRDDVNEAVMDHGQSLPDYETLINAADLVFPEPTEEP